MSNAANGMLRQIAFGKQRISYELAYSGRETLAVHVNPDKSVSVVAPFNSSEVQIQKRVQRRAAWIVKQRDYFDEFHPLPTPPKFVSGETHRFLGRQYRIKLEQSDEDYVKLIGPFIKIGVNDRDDTRHIQAQLDGWYRQRAKFHFSNRLLRCIENARSLELGDPGFSIRKMKNRWGSCTKAGRILLNLHLVKAPGFCIEYVIMHELCHLKIHNHSPDFYRLLNRCMPDWEQRKKRLATFVF